MFPASQLTDATDCAVYNPQPGTVALAPNHAFMVCRRNLTAALDQGAVDEGAPGYRTPEMYIAYFRDPVGNKLAVYTMPSVAAFAKGARKIVRDAIAASRVREA